MLHEARFRTQNGNYNPLYKRTGPSAPFPLAR
jgi:hypothetical protein